MHINYKILLFIIPLLIFTYKNQGKDLNSPFVVVVDAGHGGKDPGATNGNYQEKDINLSVALKVGDLLNNSGKNLKVILTRTTDVFLELSERTAISNKAQANLFVSIHSNASRNSSASGIETYVMGMEKSDANLQVALRENSVITQEDDYSVKYEGYDPSSSESYIIFSLQQYSSQFESLKVATELQNKYTQYASSRMYDKGVKQANFLVLWKTAAPSVLTEIGFISNKSDREFISSEKGQNIIAKSISEAVLEYIDSYNKEKTSTIHESITDEEEKPLQHVLQYKVQIASSSYPISITKDHFFGWTKNVVSEKIGPYYKYFIIGSNVYEETLTLRNSLRSKFPDCFIVATYDGKPIKVSEAHSIEMNTKK